MARLARVVLPGYPHHIIQRGNRRQDVFFKDEDYYYYLELLKQWCVEEQVEIWSYCLMTNHVHLILTPGPASISRGQALHLTVVRPDPVLSKVFDFATSCYAHQ